MSDDLDLRQKHEENERQLAQLTRKLRALQQVSYQINNSYDLQELSSSICTLATQALGAQYAGLYHLDGEGLKVIEDLAVVKPKGMSLLKMLQEASNREASQAMSLKEAGFLAQVVATGKSIAIEDLLAAPESCPEAIREHALASVMATPLVTQREILGVFLVGTQEAHAFSSDEQELLADLAQQATGAFITSKLYAQTLEEKERADRMVEGLKNLNEAMAAIATHLSVGGACEALIERLPTFLPIEEAALFLRRGDGWPFMAGQRRFFDELPFQWRVAMSAQGVAKSLSLSPASLVGTPYEAFGRVMAFPLIVQQEVQGVVVCATSPQLDPTAVELVETLVGHTALTVSNAAMVEKVERQAITDGLTGVYNRRYFNDRLLSEMQRSQRYGHQLSLIIMDIDFFKMANDVLGHLGGDTVLKQLATLLKDKVRKVDIVARYGGEEFAIILPETGYDSGLHVAERIRGWIEEFPFTDQEKLPHKVITASLGVATYPVHAMTMDELIHTADEALYQAKQAGRNRVGRIPSAQKA
ncbi:sensor domain-containing diguanylate cyclase [bacterium]|nr:sensor domain-containing diguanylate cyclase [bacterium]